jgi:hypothetical protein
LIPTFDVDELKFGEGGLTTYKESNRIQFAKKIHVYITVILIYTQFKAVPSRPQPINAQAAIFTLT